MDDRDSVINMEKDPSGVSSDNLQFQDIPHSGAASEDVTPSKTQTHTFNNFPDDQDSEEEEGKTDLLQGDKKQPSFWTFEYYTQFFDVDTRQVLGRIIGSFFPNPKSNYLQKHIRPKPDLYGPFWICTTLVFTTAIAGNMANYIQHSGKDYEWRYDFHKVTFAAAAIFSYWWAVPTMLFTLLWWRGNPAGFGYSEMICVYGYSLSIYVPISILWVIQFNWLQWLLVMVGMVLSGGVLLLTFWPAVREDNKKISLLTMAFIFLLHGLLAIGFVLYFFHVPDVPIDIVTTTSMPLSIIPENDKISTIKSVAKNIMQSVSKATTTISTNTK